MAVTRVNQGEIVEVPFELPDGSILPHLHWLFQMSIYRIMKMACFMFVLCYSYH